MSDYCLAKQKLFNYLNEDGFAIINYDDKYNFIGYRTTCYGETNEVPQEYTDSKGNTTRECSSEALIIVNNKCIFKINIFFW